MELRSRVLVGLSVALLVVGCGGEEAPAAGTPAAAPPEAPASEQAVVDSTEQQEQQQAGNTELVREAFTYSSAGRDPFMSLLRSGDVRPMPQDLRVRAINYDPRYPQRSVVTLQDTTANKRYTLRVGDQVGRVRVARITETEVVITIEEFGVERQLSLPIRRRQEDNSP